MFPPTLPFPAVILTSNPLQNLHRRLAHGPQRHIQRGIRHQPALHDHLPAGVDYETESGYAQPDIAEDVPGGTGGNNYYFLLFPLHPNDQCCV